MEEQHNQDSPLTYDQLFSKAQAIQPYFAADLAQFATHDPWFTTAVNTKLLSNIYLGMKDFSESSLLIDIKQVNDLLDTLFKDAIRCYEKLNYYLDLGFQNGTLNNETFGYPGLAEAQHSAKKMIDLLNRAQTALMKQNKEGGHPNIELPEGLALDVSNIAADLAALNGELNILKKQHLLLTQQRAELFNAVLNTLTKIHESAKIIFANQPDHLALYDLYDSGVGSVDMKEFMHLN